MTVPINIDDATGMGSADFAVSFNTAELGLTNVTLGTLDASGFGLTYYVVGDEVGIDAYATNGPLAGGSGSIFDLNFNVQSGAAIGVTPVTIAAGPGEGLNGDGLVGLTLTSGSVDIHVPTVATPAAANPSPVTGTSTALSVLGADDADESNLTYTWSYTGPTGVTYTGNTNGTNAAKNITADFTQAGNYSFTATITDSGGFSATSTVDVTVDQTTTNIVVSPATSPVVPVGFAQQFSASATDQFGNPITSFAWGISGNGNSIDGTGNATLGSTPGSYTVTANVGATQGTATVIAENFAVPASSTLDINLGAAGPVALTASGGNITASRNGVQITFTLASFTGVTVADLASNDVLNFNGPLALPFTFLDSSTSTVNVNSGVLTFAAVMGGSVNLGTLSISNGAEAMITPATTQNPTTLNVNSLSIATTGRLDVTNNEMIVNYGASDPISTIAGYLTSGRNNGAWNGPGIDSSAAAGNSAYALGYADGNDGKVAGLSSGQIEVKYTLLGDANLDGLVNAADFNILSTNFNEPVTGWDQGDFNYDGLVNAADFTDLAANFNQSANITAVANAPTVAAVVVEAQASSDVASTASPAASTTPAATPSATASTATNTKTVPVVASTTPAVTTSTTPSAAAKIPAAPTVVSATPTVAKVTTKSAAAAPAAPKSKPVSVSKAVIGKVTNGKPKASAVTTYAASVVPSAGAGSTATPQSINKDAKFLADR
ncbi:MAG: cohesin domain-containing protein [Tepidisphaeraceae bacterium]